MGQPGWHTLRQSPSTELSAIAASTLSMRSTVIATSSQPPTFFTVTWKHSITSLITQMCSSCLDAHTTPHSIGSIADSGTQGKRILFDIDDLVLTPATPPWLHPTSATPWKKRNSTNGQRSSAISVVLFRPAMAYSQQTRTWRNEFQKPRHSHVHVVPNTFNDAQLGSLQ
jgi:hypothetical protein